MAVELKEFSSSCFACFDDCGICCMTYCLPCVTYGQNVNDLKGTGCVGPCLAYCCLAGMGCPCIVAAGTRTEIRQKYGLKEEPCSDCLMHFPCCSPCGLCQEARELKKYGKH